MRIGIVSDTHFGYTRFYKDSITQGREAIIKAIEKSDVLIHAGDMFDSRLPSFETLKQVLDIWKEAFTFKKPIIAIHGNHERRIKGYTNPVNLISTTGMIKYLHGEVVSIEKGEERINILGIGSVPEEHSKLIIEKSIENNREMLKEGKNILVIHQMIKEFDPTESTELSLSYLESLDFEVIIDGHLHKRHLNDSSKLIVAGSTVVTSLDESEIAHNRGFVVYDTKTRKKEFFEIKQRKILSKTLEFKNAGYEEISLAIEKEYNQMKLNNENAIIRIKITGKIREGLIPSLIHIPKYPDLYVKNNINGSLKDELEAAKKYFNYENVNKWADEEIKRKLRGKTKVNEEKLLSILYETDDLERGMELLLNEE